MTEVRPLHLKRALGPVAAVALSLSALAACGQQAPEETETARSMPDAASTAEPSAADEGGAGVGGAAATGTAAPGATGTAASGAVNPEAGKIGAPPPTLPEETERTTPVPGPTTPPTQ